MSREQFARNWPSLQLKLFTLVLTSIVYVSPDSGWCLTRAPDIERLVAESDVILVGTVLEDRSYTKNLRTYDQTKGYDPSGEFTYEEVLTDFLIQITEVLKGELVSVGENFTITSIGGIATERGAWTTMSYFLPKGEQVVIFADYDDKNDIWWGHQHSLGVYGIEESEGEQYLTAQTKEPVFVGGEIVSREEYMQSNKEELTLTHVRELLVDWGSN